MFCNLNRRYYDIILKKKKKTCTEAFAGYDPEGKKTKLLPWIQAQLPRKPLTSGLAAERATKQDGPLEEEQGAPADGEQTSLAA